MSDKNPHSAPEEEPNKETEEVSSDSSVALYQEVNQVLNGTKTLLRQERQLRRIEKSLGCLGLMDAFRSTVSKTPWVSIDAETNQMVFANIPPERFTVFAMQLEEIVVALNESFAGGSAPSPQGKLVLGPLVVEPANGVHLGGNA